MDIQFNNNNNTKVKVNYVDYLCVVNEFRKKGITEQLIQNHDYNQRINNPSIQISLFKREGAMNFIVPLCIYQSYLYNNKVTIINNNKQFYNSILNDFYFFLSCTTEKK
jgi:hypothetical protein